jgi:hypothetical protein
MWGREGDQGHRSRRFVRDVRSVPKGGVDGGAKRA